MRLSTNGASGNGSKYLQLHPYRRHTSTPTHFLPSRNVPCFPAFPAALTCRSDGAGTAIMGICRIIESGLFDGLH
jgi:hypothetical protein